MENYDVVKKDFNEISDIVEDRWNHNNCYFKNIVKYLSEDNEVILEIGCGKGELSNLLAKKSDHVIAVDLADRMIEKAISQYGYKNIDFVSKNILDMEFEENSLDAIVTTATAHHLPYEWLLLFALRTLKPRGKLIILDLYKVNTFTDMLLNLLAVIPNMFMNIVHNKKIKSGDEHSREVWKRHGEHDTYMTLEEMHMLVQKYLPGAVIRRKLFWRYLMIWEK
ncbi:class I SAM-dependent methyltransferase [Ruminiclostridium josui]|uniref:class I SAM-dependent methyltransferase n=1 Tax=Ruminiclostridium josui TaxID=1499 RepID=UPI00046409AD|nr:class I SAM-dependent methyltransferase [Ruminiclostridium josui]